MDVKQNLKVKGLLTELENTFGIHLENGKSVEINVQEEISYWQKRSENGTDNGSFFEILQPLAEKLSQVQVIYFLFFF